MSSLPLPRLLTIMGSGETAPTMVKVHRSVLDRLGPPPVPAVLLDTPFGFQENAPEIAARIVHYFSESLLTHIDVASTGGEQVAAPGSADPFADEKTMSSVRDARYVFAGPGSPSYALRKWQGTVLPDLLREKLEHGGAVTFSSAAALTLGSKTVPVYEVYKVGDDPFWLDGLDLLAAAGLNAVVIPHYNNAEGGTHDTRFCYLGERRLAALEPELPEGAFVLGVDEHTAIVLDLEERKGTVAGNGVVTVRANGSSRTLSSGETVSFEEIAQSAEELRSSPGPSRRSEGLTTDPVQGPDPLDGERDASIAAPRAGYERSPILDLVREQEAAFSRAVANRDTTAAVAAILELESQITAWSYDIPAGDALDRAHASLRSLVVDLGRRAEAGIRDPRTLLAPFVEALLQLRDQARTEKRYSESDVIRDRLLDLGIEVRDTTDGSVWELGS